MYKHPQDAGRKKTLHVLEEIPAACAVAIYGTGQSGKELKKLLDRLRPDIKVAAFIDSFLGSSYHGSTQTDTTEIVNVKDLDSVKGKYSLILVASDYWAEIESILIERGIGNYIIVDCHELYALEQRFLSTRPERPCHYQELFIRTDGDVFPCCNYNILIRPSMRIGHLTDPDILEKIDAFDSCCSCNRYRLRHGGPQDSKRYVLLYLEVSRQCNSQCPMCFSEAPSWKGSYGYYEELTKIVDATRPIVLRIMGGEVLLQKDALKWVAEMRLKHTATKFALLTNGNHPLSKLPMVEQLFHMVGISTIVGFQPETYKRMTGMNLKRTVRFAEQLVARKKTGVGVAYLMTPINFHEANLFLRWAVPLGFQRIHIADATIEGYIRMDTWDNYWAKLIDRTADSIKSALVSMKETIKKQGTAIWFTNANARMFKLDKEFIDSAGLTGFVMLSSEAYYERFERIVVNAQGSDSLSGIWEGFGTLPFF